MSQRSAASGSLQPHRLLQRCVHHPDEDLAKYDQVLQLGPFFFPNRSGIKVFGSTKRMRDLVKIIGGSSAEMIGVLREQLDVQQILVAIGPVIRG